jgi:hypothetical protein
MTGHARRVYTLRLPLSLASQLEALHDLHPQTPRAQLLADVMALGLAEVRRAHGSPPPAPMAPQVPDEREAVYLVTGPFAAFHGLVCKHHLALEQELAPHETMPMTDPYALDQPG